ncbi:hypothetical protein HHK36_025019 [Tetracentron sinense]|uniref:Uncharacterized protein n=1 Tax=Tetracentron sinense TaxID=13715 RepID=A0A835D4T2_TETSI|nr:hypothetical protein HHK36_025019 [Tetracentron sinense]
MEEMNSGSEKEQQYHNWPAMSPEIVEIGENSNSVTSSSIDGAKDVYVAVGKDDFEVLKWALEHALLPGTRIFLVHVFASIDFIPTPDVVLLMEVGRISRNQVSREQVKTYMREENTRRRNLLQKYISLCTDAKVVVDTMLIESNLTAKAILDLIPVLNITTLVMGTKRSPSSRQSRKGLRKSEFVQKHAPDFCEVTIVFDGKRVVESQQKTGLEPSSSASSGRRQAITPLLERNFFECGCFPGKFN